MMPTGDPWWGNSWTSGTTNVTWTFTDNTTGYPVQQPFVAVPVQPVAEPVDDSPLAWLRAQVAEIVELASAA